jgi:uncharacterized repeat protein (TIGR01451 family)
VHLPARAGTEGYPSTRTDQNARTRVAFVGFIALLFYQSIIGAQTVSPPGTRIVNVASVTAQSGTGQITRVSNPVSTTVAAISFSLTKSVNPSGTVQPGSTLRYTLRFENTFGFDQTGVTLTDLLDSVFTGASGLTSGTIPDLGTVGGSIAVTGSYDAFAREVTYAIPNLPAGFIGEVQFQAKLSASIPSDSLVLNRFSATSDQDPVGVISAEVASAVVGPALNLSMTASRGQVEVGDLTGFRMQITNLDPTMNLSGARVVFRMPEGLRFQRGSFRIAGKTGKTPLVRGQGQTLILSLGNLQAGETIESSLVGIVSAGATTGEQNATARADARTPSGLRVRSGPASTVLRIVRGVLAMEAVIVGRVFADLDDDGRPSLGEPAIPGVRIYLEDGTQVLTDIAGKYHMEGIRPGLHVLKIDPETLPPGLAAAPAGLRSFGHSGVQFVDLNASELFKANYPLRGSIGALAGLKVRLLNATPDVDLDSPRVRENEDGASGSTGSSGMAGVEISSVLATAIFEQGSSVLRIDAEEHLESLALLLRERGAMARKFIVEETGDASTILGRARVRAFEGALRRALRINSPVKPGGGEPLSGKAAGSRSSPESNLAIDPAAKKLKTLSPGLYLLKPESGELFQRERIDIELAFPTGEMPRLMVGDEVILDDRIGARMETSLSGMSLYRFVGIPLSEGENAIIAESVGGEMPRRITVYVERRGIPASITVRGQGGSQPADGKSPGRAEIEVRDARGHTVPDGTIVTVETLSGQILGTDGDRVAGGFQIKTTGGKAVVRLSASQIAEDRIVKARTGGVEGEGTVRFGTHLRKWILTGVGEAGWSGENDEAEEDLLSDMTRPGGTSARLALYAKGKIGAKDLISISYDSDRQRDQDALFRVQDPSENFPVYGDSSVQSYDLQSQGKLALRWERDRSMAMVGDFHTGLNAAELARYDRVLTGAFTRIETSRLSVQAFGASTPQRSARDAIRADGSSGPYRLSRKPVVAYSERVILEVRDRFHTERILSSSVQTRYVDYDIDYISGTLLFRSPVSAEDQGFNPVTLVVTYELVDPDGSNLVAGGRVAYRPTTKLEWGTTAIQEERGDGDLWITGADLTVRPWAGASITGEYAQARTAGVATGAVAVKFSSAIGDKTSLLG